MKMTTTTTYTTRKELIKRINEMIESENDCNRCWHLESWLEGLVEDGTNIHYAQRRMREQGFEL